MEITDKDIRLEHAGDMEHCMLNIRPVPHMTNKEGKTLIKDIPKALKIMKLLKERREWYIKDNKRCIDAGLNGTALHYDTIIEELNLVSGHVHKWKYLKRWKRCDGCDIIRELSEKEFKLLEHNPYYCIFCKKVIRIAYRLHMKDEHGEEL